MNSNEMNNLDSEDYVFKFVIIGDSGVGKSCIMHHFIFNKFKKDTTQTIGVEFSSKSIKLGNKTIKLQLWDTAGQEKFRSVARSYYRGAIGHITSWLNDAKGTARNECSICIVGNKSDMKEARVIKYNDGAKFCQENNLIHFECSAFTGDNVDEIFTSITKHIMNKIENGIIEPSSVVSSYASHTKKIDILNTNESSKSESSCQKFEC